MNCPTCKAKGSSVVDSRCFNGRSVFRRRSCNECRTRWSTEEEVIRDSITTSDDTISSQPVGNRLEPNGQPVGDQLGFDAIAQKERKKQRKKNNTPASLDASASPRKPKQDPRIGQIFGIYRPKWKAAYGLDWRPEPGLDRNALAFLQGLDQLPDPAGEFAQFGAQADRFLADKRPFLVQAKHPLRLFFLDANRYRTAAPAAVGAAPARKLLVATPDLFGAKGTGDVPA